MTEPAAAKNEDDRDDLIAYLDGELDARRTRQVEAKLSQDSQARQEADLLRRTWQILDYLPRPEPSPTFASRTLERVSAMLPATVAATAFRPGGAPWWRRPWILGLGWAAAVLVTFGASHAAVRRFAPGPGQGGAWAHEPPTEDQLAQNLRLLENRRLYELAWDLDFIKELDSPDFFGDDS